MKGATEAGGKLGKFPTKPRHEGVFERATTRLAYLIAIGYVQCNLPV